MERPSEEGSWIEYDRLLGRYIYAGREGELEGEEEEVRMEE
jgi:hypothetical protein